MNLKITTWNVNSLKVRLPHVLEFLEREQPDVLCLQELKMQDKDIPREEIEAKGYDLAVFGQKTYNGVATLYKRSLGSGLAEQIRNIPGFDDPQARLLAGTITAEGKPLRIVNGYFPNGESSDSEKFPYKMAWLDALTKWLETEIKTYPNLVLLGDFNIAPADADVKNPETWKDSVLCLPEVRQKFQNLLGIGLADSFRQHQQPENVYSWWDYRMLAFRKNIGLRIDHILITKSLFAANKSVVVNKDFRAKERPSDHAPVTLTLDLTDI